MLKLILPFLLLTITIFPQAINSQDNKITTGSKNGTLIAIGGGKLSDTNIMTEFRKLAGGDSAKIVVIPTAFVRNNEIDTILLKRNFKKYGIPNFTILHTSDSTEANTDDFVDRKARLCRSGKPS